MSIWNFVLNWVEHGKSFITSGPGSGLLDSNIHMLIPGQVGTDGDTEELGILGSTDIVLVSEGILSVGDICNLSLLGC